MGKGMNALIAVAAVYGATQFTIAPLMRSNIDAFAAELVAQPAHPDGTIGPVGVRSSDICTLLTQPDSWKGRGERLAFLEAGTAADRLTQNYTFVPVGECSKYNRRNLIVARRATQ